MKSRIQTTQQVAIVFDPLPNYARRACHQAGSENTDSGLWLAISTVAAAFKA
jgi:hypothetical protein